MAILQHRCEALALGSLFLHVSYLLATSSAGHSVAVFSPFILSEFIIAGLCCL